MNRPKPVRASSRSRDRILVWALIAATVAAIGCSEPRHARHHGHGFTGDTGTVEMISAEVGGKNVFLPATVVIRSGEPVTLSVFNTTSKAHGFSIPALGIAEVLPPGEEFPIELPALEGHQLLQIGCQLHTTHRKASLIVLPSRQGADADQSK